MAEKVNTRSKGNGSLAGSASAGPGEGTGGDAGSGPTGAVTPEDIAEESEAGHAAGEAGPTAPGGRSPDGLIGAAVVSFVAGLVTGLLLGWRATR
jgi:hypothetical protein